MNTLQRQILMLGAVAALCGGSLFGQGRGPGGPGFGGPGGLNFLATTLGLTDAQKTQAQTIFDAARTASDPIRTQLQALETNVEAAIKANNQAQLTALATQRGTLDGQLALIQFQAQAKFYLILTPDQQAKYDALQASRPRGPMHRGEPPPPAQ